MGATLRGWLSWAFRRIGFRVLGVSGWRQSVSSEQFGGSRLDAFVRNASLPCGFPESQRWLRLFRYLMVARRALLLPPRSFYKLRNCMQRRPEGLSDRLFEGERSGSDEGIPGLERRSRRIPARPESVPSRSRVDTGILVRPSSTKTKQAGSGRTTIATRLSQNKNALTFSP